MATTSAAVSDEFTWEVQPAAAAWVADTVATIERRHATVARLTQLLHEKTGTRLVDWIDHLSLDREDAGELTDIGYERQPDTGVHIWRHPLGMFPPLRFGAGGAGLALRVDSVDDALAALPGALAVSTPTRDEVVGPAGGPYRQVRLREEQGVSLWLSERHGYPRFEPPAVRQAQIDAAAGRLQSFHKRQRKFTELADGFAYTAQLFAAAAEELGTAWACDLFFNGERVYWQSRNRAARVQYERQNRLGLGWANHDHHTYRSSRRAFHRLIGSLEQMGFQCRERFYAGREAGWGAQVLEQPDCRIVIFADVDLSPDEVLCDFAHEPLPERDALGTVGLWCELQGEAFFEAGMHHLECQFDFDAARAQLAALGVESLAPFTNFPFLRQAFTKGEIWQVEPARVDRLLAAGRITAEQADRFRREGVLGSHLEILERNDGYKGFNQTGISDIITRTDPRRVVGA
jgi:hypothetical protein